MQMLNRDVDSSGTEVYKSALKPGTFVNLMPSTYCIRKKIGDNKSDARGKAKMNGTIFPHPYLRYCTTRLRPVPFTNLDEFLHRDNSDHFNQNQPDRISTRSQHCWWNQYVHPISFAAMATSGIRPEAQSGFAAAAAYDASRPTYLPEAVDRLLEKLQVANLQSARILEIAAGTGKFTEVLAARPEQFEIVAVEPHDDMRQELSNKKLPGVTVVKGTAEHIEGIEDGGFAAVIAAQVGRPSLWGC